MTMSLPALAGIAGVMLAAVSAAAQPAAGGQGGSAVLPSGLGDLMATTVQPVTSTRLRGPREELGVCLVGVARTRGSPRSPL
jgi:hypothetical protein